MEIKQKRDGEKLTVQLTGRLDAVTAIQLDKEISKMLDGVEDLTMDFADLAYIASAGLRILLKLQKRMNIPQGNFKIINVKPDVREVLDMTGFSRLLTIEDTSAPKKLSFNF